MVLPHELLGVSPDADLPTIKRSFRALVKEWHPDRSRDPRASARFREVVNAYRSLVRERTHRTQPWRSPSVTPPPVPTWTAATQTYVASDLAWDDRVADDRAFAYPIRLSRYVVLGIVGFVALLWISAFLSQL